MKQKWVITFDFQAQKKKKDGVVLVDSGKLLVTNSAFHTVVILPSNLLEEQNQKTEPRSAREHTKLVTHVSVKQTNKLHEPIKRCFTD
jgi:hypothetical protein